MRRLVFLAVAVMLVSSGLSLADEEAHGSLVGTWLFKVTFGPVEFRYLQTFNADGVSTAILPDPGPLGPDTRNACLGQWKRHGRQFDMAMYCLESQALNGFMDKITTRFTLSEDGTRLSDPHFKAEWWSGDVYLGAGYGAMEGVRLLPVHRD